MLGLSPVLVKQFPRQHSFGVVLAAFFSEFFQSFGRVSAAISVFDDIEILIALLTMAQPLAAD